MAFLNQKQLYRKSKNASVAADAPADAPASAPAPAARIAPTVLKPRNLFGTQIIIPRGMILEKRDPDGEDPTSTSDENEEDEEDKEHSNLRSNSTSVDGKQFVLMTEDEERDKIPSTKTYEICDFENNAFLIANRLHARPPLKNSSNYNIILTKRSKIL